MAEKAIAALVLCCGWPLLALAVALMLGRRLKE